MVALVLLLGTAFADSPRPAPIQPRGAPSHETRGQRPAAVPQPAQPRYVPRYAPRYDYRAPYGYYAPYAPYYYGYRPYVWAPPVAPPPPVPRRDVADAPPPSHGVSPKARKKLDRARTLAVGIRGGSLFGGYEAGEMFVDPGIGLAVRYRPESAVGLEISAIRFDPTAFLDDSPRVHALWDGSIEYFFAAKSPVSPYVLGGATYTARRFDDEFRADGRTDTLRARDANWGPHAGVGLEIALGRSVAIDLEGRYTALMTAPIEDPTFPGVVTANAAAMLHF
jgi:hypothetical protein